MPDTIMQPPPAAAPVREKSRMLVVCENIQQMTPKFQAALPAHIPPEKFVRTVLTTIQLNPDIAKCDPTSIYNECIKAAADGLIIDGREAALVKYNAKKPDGSYGDVAKYMPMVAGLLKKARNSGEISSIVGRCVYQNDKFHVVYGDDEKLTHEPCLDGEPGPVRLAYMVAKLKDGTLIRHVMTLNQINKRRAASKSGSSGSSPWSSWFDEMAVKTVLRAGSKFLPASSDRADFGDLIERDDDLYDANGADPLAAAEPVDQQQTEAPRQRLPRQARSATAAMNAAPEASDQGKETDLFEYADPETGEVSMVTQEELAAKAMKRQAEAAAPEPKSEPAPSIFVKPEAPTSSGEDAGEIPPHLRRSAAKPEPVSEANPPPPSDDDVI